MKILLLCLLLLNLSPLMAKDNQIKISEDQISNLDIKIGNLMPSQQIPLFYAPAKVVVPAYHDRLISSSQSGLVVQLQANIGDSVEKNQLLAVINSPELLNLQREFLTAAGELHLSELEFNRDNKLLQEGVIADRRWQQSNTVYQGKLAQYDTNKQLLALVGMSTEEINNLAQTRKLDSQLKIHAPIKGVILEKFISLGSRLDTQAPIYRLADLSELWLEINIPQERLKTIHIGDQVKIENSVITGKISLLGQNVNHENQTVLARALLSTSTGELRVGQNINVQIMQNSAKPSFKVVNSAISQFEGHNYIFVRTPDGFTVTAVEIIGKKDNESLITAPLTGNEQIAIKGTVALKANWLGLGSSE